jgi:lipoprotein
MKKIMIMLGILIGAVSCSSVYSTNGATHKTEDGSVFRTVCASRYDCTQVRVENSDYHKWYNGEMSDEEYSKKHPDLWMTDEEWDSL